MFPDFLQGHKYRKHRNQGQVGGQVRTSLRVAFGLMEGWRRLPAMPTFPSLGLTEQQCPKVL